MRGNSGRHPGDGKPNAHHTVGDEARAPVNAHPSATIASRAQIRGFVVENVLVPQAKVTMMRDVTMSILITGGTGLIGGHLCRALIERGDRLTVLTRRPDRASVRWPQIRFTDTLETLDVNERLNAVVNLAGESIATRPWTRRRRKKLRDSRIGTTERLMTLIERLDQKPEVLVSGSALGYYGQHPSRTFSEDSEPIPGSFSHALCKDWEAAAARAADLGVRVCTMRTALVLARDGGLLKQMLLPFRLGLGARIGNGDQWMSWIHIRDLTQLLVQALDDERFAGPVNAAAPHAVTNREFTRTFGKVLHRPTPFVMPAFALKALLGQMAEELLIAGTRIAPERATQLGVDFAFPRLEDALTDLLVNSP